MKIFSTLFYAFQFFYQIFFRFKLSIVWVVSGNTSLSHLLKEQFSAIFPLVVSLSFLSYLIKESLRKVSAVSLSGNFRRIFLDGEFEAILPRRNSSTSLGSLKQTDIIQAPWLMKLLRYLSFQFILISSKSSSCGAGALEAFLIVHQFRNYEIKNTGLTLLQVLTSHTY